MTTERAAPRDLTAEKRAKLAAALGEIEREVAEVEAKIVSTRAERGAMLLSARLNGEAAKPDKALQGLLARKEELQAAIEAAATAQAEIDDAHQRLQLAAAADELAQRALVIREEAARADEALKTFTVARRNLAEHLKNRAVPALGLTAGDIQFRERLRLTLNDVNLNEPWRWHSSVAEAVRVAVADCEDVAARCRAAAERPAGAPLPVVGDVPARIEAAE